MAWQDTAMQLLGAQSRDVISRLSSINPNYDWTKAISEYVPALNAAYGTDWQDPGRGSSAGIVSALLKIAQSDGQRWAAAALPAAQAEQQRQQDQIQRSQYHPSGGLFGDLGPIAQLAALIPGPQQPFILAANAANAASQGNVLGAIANSFGAINGFGSAAASAPAAGNAATGVAAGGNGMSGVLDTIKTVTGGGDPWQVAANGGLSSGVIPSNGPGLNLGMGVTAPSAAGIDMTGFINPAADVFSPAYTPNYDFLGGTGKWGVNPGADGLFSGMGNIGANVGGTIYDLAGVPNSGEWMPGQSFNWPSVLNDNSTISLLKKLASGLLTGGGSGARGIGGSGGLFNPDGSLNFESLGGVVGSALPGIAALKYANDQPGIDVAPLQAIIDNSGSLDTSTQQAVLQRLQESNPGADLSQVLATMRSTDPAAALKGVLSQIDANQPGYIQAVTDPVQRNIAAGYGALRTSQALRGLGGSSFGDTSLANYMDQGNRTLADAGATATQGILGLKGNIAGNIGTLTNQNLGQQASTASQIGTLKNANLGQQGEIASGIFGSQLSKLGAQGALQQGLIGLKNTAQKNKNDLFGRAFSAFGNMGRSRGFSLGDLGLAGGY